MKIALLSCEKFPDLIPADQLLIPELAKYNIDAQAVVWDDETVDWTDYDYLIFRNTWDYYEKEQQFNQWLDHIEKHGIKTLNPVAIIQMNKHKFYLKDLEAMGFPIIPTVFIPKTKALNLLPIIPQHWKKAVVKPAFSAGSYLTAVFDIGDIQEINAQYASIASEKDLLLQQFMPEIKTLGETSFIFFNKKFSHCVNKKPANDDFRVQIQYGGNYTLIFPDAALLQKVQQIVDTFPNPLLYARIDGIVIENELLLMEIECIEPDLYFNLSEGSLQRFVKAVVELIQ